MNRMNNELRLLFLVLLAVVSLASCSNEPTRTAPSPETVRNTPVLAVQQANVQIKLHNETGGSVVVSGGQLAA